MQGTTALRLNYPQSKFKLAKDHFVCIKGTWGCGKSRAALMTANDECEDYPNNLYLILRKEWVDLRDSTLHDWTQWIDKPIDGEKNVHYTNGSVLMFRHGEDLNALKNVNLGGALMIQAEEMSEDDLWFLNGRLRRQEGTRQLRVECNYDGHNWIYRLFNEQKIGALITTNTFDNEINLPPDYIPNLKKLPKKLQDRHLYGTDEDTEGLVWDEFKLSEHVIFPYEIPRNWVRGFCVDHGFRNPTAVNWYAIDYDGNLIFYDEHYLRERPVSHHAQAILKKGLQKGLCDPSMLAKNQFKGDRVYSIADEYRDFGVTLIPAAKSEELAQLNRVNEMFKAGRIKIFKNCTHTIQEVSSWKWKKLKSGANKNDPEEPEDKDNHTCDNIKMIVSSRLSSPEHEAKLSYTEHSLTRYTINDTKKSWHEQFA